MGRIWKGKGSCKKDLGQGRQSQLKERLGEVNSTTQDGEEAYKDCTERYRNWVWKSATSRMGSSRGDPNQPSLLGKSQIGALSERHGPRICPSLFELIQLFEFIPLPVHAALLVGGSRTLERLSRNDLWEIKENRLSQPKIIAIALTDRSPPCCFSSRSPLSSALRFPSRNLRVVPPNVGTQNTMAIQHVCFDGCIVAKPSASPEALA